MFRSGLGKSVSVKQSSITKALSILGDEGDAFANTGSRCSSPFFFFDIIILLFICRWYLTLTPVQFPQNVCEFEYVCDANWMEIRQKGLLW